MRFTPLAVALASLAAAAAPAYAQAPQTVGAQAPQTVGAPQTITDPAGEINGSATPAAPAAMTGSVQLHHETTRPDRPRTPSPSHHTSAPDPPVTHTVPVAVHTSAPAGAPSDPAPSPPQVARAGGRQLPFTGIAAWQLAAAGLALIGVGYALWGLSPEV